MTALNPTPTQLNSDTGKRAHALLDQLVAWRRHLHAHPELGFHEHQTAAYIKSELEKMPGLTVSQLTPTSVLAVLKGRKPGNTVLLRADIDALPIQEENSFDFVSQNPGVMHACGHDGHTAILLGVAKLLSESQGDVSGEVRMIFQHAEEIGPGGAEELVQNTPLMDGVDVVTGLHLASGLPTGTVAIKRGAFMASPDAFKLTIHGKGGHAAHPDQTIDPIAVGAQVVSNLQHIASRYTDPIQNIVVSVTCFHAGTAHNVIPESAKLEGTVRTFDPKLRERAPQWMERIIGGICEAHGASYTFSYEPGYRAVINTDWVADVLTEIARREVGDKAVEAVPSMGGEDFSAYLTKAPGAYFNLGSGNTALESHYPHHHPRFTMDEDALMTGVVMLYEAAAELGQPKA